MPRPDLTNPGIEGCPHRAAAAEGARCALLRGLLGDREGTSCAVDRRTCEECCRSFPPTIERPNPVVASLLFSRASRMAASAPPGFEADRLRSVAELGRTHLDVLFDAPLAAPIAPTRPSTLADLVPPPASRHGRRVRDWAVGVTTAPRLQPTLEPCLDSLARAGWERPRLFIDAAVRLPERFARLPCTFRDERIGAWPSYFLALAELLLRHPRADAYMVVQDDALFFDREPVPDYLGAVLWPDRPPCVASLYCSDSDTAASPGWHPSRGEMRSGPVALVFPRDVAKAFLSDPAVFEHRWDPDEVRATSIGGVISRWLLTRGVPVWLPTPSLVQHVGDTSTLWPMARALGARRARRFAGDDATASPDQGDEKCRDGPPPLDHIR